MEQTIKPSISEEAKARITAFVAAVASLQEQYGVRLCADTDNSDVYLRDAKRTDQWVYEGSIYGKWDAYIQMTDEAPHTNKCAERQYWEPCICGAIDKGVSVANLKFEDFDGFGK